jgi:hypothetical protein
LSNEKRTQHPRDRAKERYKGLELSIQDVLDIAKLLKPFSHKPVGTTSDDGNIRIVRRNDYVFPPRIDFVVNYKDMKLHGGYNPLAECITTFLDPFPET